MNVCSLRHQEILAIELTQEEIDYAIWQAKYIKWQRKRNEEQEMVSYKAVPTAFQTVENVVEKRSPKVGDKAYKTPETGG